MIKINRDTFKNYFMTAWKELAVIVGVLFLDLLSKFLIGKTMSLGQTKVIISKFLNFTFTLNTEAAFNFAFFGLDKKIGTDGLRIVFIVFITLATIVFGIVLVRAHKGSFLYRLPLALIIGGALGNYYDRIVHEGVRDFIEIEYFGGTLFGFKSFPIFNLADSALVIGVILFLVYYIFFDSKYQKRKQQEKLAAENQINADTEAPDISEKFKD